MTEGAHPITRRAALRLLAAAGLSPLLVAGCRDAGPDARTVALVPLVGEPAAMARIGRLWLDGLEQGRSLESLVDSLLSGATGDLSEGRLRQELSERLRRDWLESRVTDVNGYTFAVTELELYALAEQLRERAVATA